MDTAVNRRYPNRKILKTTRYEPAFQGKWYEDDSGAMLLNYGDKLGCTRTEEENVEQVIGVIMVQ